MRNTWFKQGVCVALLSVVSMAAFAKAAPARESLLSPAQQAAAKYVQATVHFDASALEQLLAASYVEISPIGEVDVRSRVIGFYPPEQQGKTPDVSAELTDWQQQSAGADLVVTSAKLTYRSLTQASQYELRVQFVLQQQQGQWRLLSSQYTPIRPKKAKS